MRLRTKLILAFLLLSVLPLTGITTYSYYSSVKAFRETVEAEANATTEEMSERMAVVTGDLDRRIRSLGDLPYDAVLAKDAGPGEGPSAQRFVTDLVSTMGESARMLEALEFMPAAPATLPTAPPAPRVVRIHGEATAAVESFASEESEPTVISLAGLWGGSDTGSSGDVDNSKLRVVRLGNVSLLVPEADGVHIEALTDGDVEVGDVINIVARYAGVAAELAQEGELELFAERFAATVEREVASLVDDDQKREEQDRMVTERVHEFEQHARAPRMLMAREFIVPVEREGEVVAEVRAKLDTERVLTSILSQQRRELGEIVFAVDAEGNVYTPDPADRAILEEELAGSLPSFAPGGDEAIQVTDKWAVVMQEDPESRIAFGIARPVGNSLEQIRQATGRNLLYGLGMIGLAMVGIVPLSTRMTRSLSRLSEGVDRLASGDLETRVDVGSRDEIGRLGQAFNHMAAQLTEHQERRVAQERLQKELEIGRQIQADLLPQGSKRLPFGDVHAVSIPAREVGGDFFNYFALPDGSVALLIGDVSGKGVPAALLMANLQAILRARLSVENDLERLSFSLDREIEDTTPAEAYLTLFVGVISASGDRLRYINAGHNTQFLFGPGGKLERLESSGRPLGLLSGGGHVERSVPLHDGDALCLFTDGLTEAENASGEEFGEDRLADLLRSAGSQEPDRVVVHVEESVRRHRGDIEAADDATVLVLRITH